MQYYVYLGIEDNINRQFSTTMIVQVNRLKGIYLFRAAVRLVLEYIEWLTEEPVVETVSDDVAINIRRAQQKKIEKKALTLEV